MIEVAIVLSMAVASALFMYAAFQFKDRHAQMKMVYSAVAMFFLIGTVFTGYMFALNGASTADLYEEVSSLASVTGQDGSAVTSFGRLSTGEMRTQLDYGSHYPFSPERLRLFLNGSREFVQYGDYNENMFVDGLDTYSMRPGPNTGMHIESAESATYIVGTEMSASFAFQINRSLNPGESIKVGPYNGRNGWYLEHRGDHPNSSTVDIVMEREGNRTVLQEDAVLPRPVTSWQRYEVEFNWYNVGNQVWIQTYTDDGEQFNEVYAKTSLDGGKGPATANLNAWYEVNNAPGSPALEFEAGSIGFQIEAGADQLVRGKPQRVVVTIPAGDDTWQPVYAVKLDNDTTVNARLNELEALRYTNNAPAELVVASVAPGKTDASNWQVPGYHHEMNSVVLDTTNVSTVPNSTGQEVDLSADEKFGGWTVSAASIEPSGSNFQAGSSTSAQTTIKRQVLASDIIVFLARSPSSGGELTFDYVIEQDY